MVCPVAYGEGSRRRLSAFFAIVPAAALVVTLTPVQAASSSTEYAEQTAAGGQAISQSREPAPDGSTGGDSRRPDGEGTSSEDPNKDPDEEPTSSDEPTESETPTGSPDSSEESPTEESPTEEPSEPDTTEPEPEPTKEPTESNPPPATVPDASTKQHRRETMMQAAPAPNGVPTHMRRAMERLHHRLKQQGRVRLGRAKSQPVRVGSGAMWRFHRGTAYWSRAAGAKALWGRTLIKYNRVGGPRSVLGFPTSNTHTPRIRSARSARFQRGRIYWSERTGAHEIHGAIENRFTARGAADRLGLPTTDERGPRRARYNVFQHARIYWSSRTGPRMLYGGILRKYVRSGGHRSWIGLPTREEFSVPGGRRANFQRARIVWNRAQNRTRILKQFSVTTHRVRRSDVRYTYRSGCPVPPRRLRRMHVVFTNFRGDAAMGNLIVHQNVVGDLTRVFRNAHRRRFNVRRILPMDVYRGDDIRAMRADNTSAFNCRHVTGNPYRLSQHSYGNAIDINTFENPYVTSSRVYPRGSRTYLNRRNVRKGMIVPSGPVARTMRRRGWPWGARWSNPDYQHFSSNGG